MNKEQLTFVPKIRPLGKFVLLCCVFHLIVRLAVLSDDFDPLQHVFSVLGLKQIFTEVLRCQPQGVLAFRFAVRYVYEATADADGLFLFSSAPQCRPFKHRLSLVLVEEQRV